eukprot:428426_1
MRAFHRIHALKSAFKCSPLLALPAAINASFEDESERISQTLLDKISNTVKSTYNDPIIALNYSMMRDENSSNMLFLEKYIKSIKTMNEFNEMTELNLLDFGCGTGATMSKTVYYVSNSMENIKTCNIIGVDFAQRMLKVADQHLDFCLNIKHKNDINMRKDIKTNYKLIEGDMRDLCQVINDSTNKENKQMFDGIVSYYAIIHVPRQDHEIVFKQCWELLKNDGILCLCTGAQDLPLDYDTWDGKPMYWSQYSMERSLEIITKCNFEIIESQFIHDSTSDDQKCGHLFVLAKKCNAKFVC